MDDTASLSKDDTASLSNNEEEVAAAVPAALLPFRNIFEIPFATARLASIAAQVLAVDKDIHPDRAGKQVVYMDGEAKITVTIMASSLKMLRTVSNSMFESVLQVQATIDAFDGTPTVAPDAKRAND